MAAPKYYIKPTGPAPNVRETCSKPKYTLAKVACDSTLVLVCINCALRKGEHP